MLIPCPPLRRTTLRVIVSWPGGTGTPKTGLDWTKRMPSPTASVIVLPTMDTVPMDAMLPPVISMPPPRIVLSAIVPKTRSMAIDWKTMIEP